MAREAFVVGPHSPLRAEERELVLSVLEALEGDAGSGDLTDAIVDQVERLELFGELLGEHIRIEGELLGAVAERA